MLKSGSIDVHKLYKRRNVVLIGIFIVAGVLSLVWTIFLWTAFNKFLCDVLDDDLHENYPGVDAYVCFLSHASSKLGAFTLSCSLSRLGQALFVCIGLHNIGKLVKQEESKEENRGTKKVSRKEERIAKENAMFLVLFWESASPSRSGRFQEYIQIILHYTTMEEEVLTSDIDLVRMYSRKNGSKKVGDAVSRLVKKQGSDYGKSEEYLFQVVTKMLFDLQEVQGIVKAAAEKKRWKMIVAALGKLDQDQSQHDQECNYGLKWLKELDLNFDELPSLPYLTPSDEAAGSILFYAIKGSLEVFDIFPKYILKNIQDGRVKYVHFRGKSQTLKNFVIKAVGDKRLATYADVLEYVSESMYQENPSRSQNEIEKFCAELKDVGANPSIEYLQSLTNNIYRYKFTHWDEKAKVLAKYSNEKRLWTVLVTLMNAYIVTEEDRPNVAKLDCDVTRFERLDEILPIALETQPLGSEVGYFVPTAARHILACCSRQEIKSCLKYIHEPRNNLSQIDKTNLLGFIKECDENEMTGIAQPRTATLSAGGPKRDSDSGNYTVTDPTTENGNLGKPSELTAEVHASNDQEIDRDQVSNGSEKKKLSNGSHSKQKGGKVGEQTLKAADRIQHDTSIGMEEIDSQTHC